MNQKLGVRYEYLDAPAPIERHAHECTGCGRWFRASAYRRKAENRWCPECREVESVGHSVARVLAETPPKPVLLDVEDLLDITPKGTRRDEVGRTEADS